MSINNSIANCRTSFAQGSSREVFFSKKYNVVIKKPNPNGHNYHLASIQTEREKKLFEQMTPNEKSFFPILDFYLNKDNELIELMKKATPLDICKFRFSGCLEDYSVKDRRELFDKLEAVGYAVRRTRLNALIKKYHLTDLHFHNLGILNGRLVILDFGWDREY